jgi:hypothetical protein
VYKVSTARARHGIIARRGIDARTMRPTTSNARVSAWARMVDDDDDDDDDARVHAPGCSVLGFQSLLFKRTQALSVARKGARRH